MPLLERDPLLGRVATKSGLPLDRITEVSVLVLYFYR